jgi:hypothetical protein
LAGLELSMARVEAMLTNLSTKVDNNASAMNNVIDTKLSQFRENLNTDIDNKIEGLRADIRSELTVQINQTANRMDAYSNSMANVENRVDLLEERFEASSKENDLLIKGVPIVSNEKCPNIFRRIAGAIGIGPESMPAVVAFRLGRKKPGSDRDPPILLKFCNHIEKDHFYQKYFAFKNLNLTHIGFDVDQRIVISENLTRHNQQIFQAAIKLKFERKIFQVSTNNGAVFIRKGQTSRRTMVSKLSDLDVI